MGRHWLLALFCLATLAVPASAEIPFTVNSDGDEHDADVSDGACVTARGGCTLRAAIEQANATPGDEAIVITIHVSQITLAIDHWNEPLRITRKSVTIQGPGQFIPSWDSPLPVHAFGSAQALGAAILADSYKPEGMETVGLIIAAEWVTIVGLEIAGFDIGVRVGDPDSWDRTEFRAHFSHVAIHDNGVGISFDGRQTGNGGTVQSSAVYSNHRVGIERESGSSEAVYLNSVCIGTLPDCSTAAGNGTGISFTWDAPSVQNSVISGNDVGVGVWSDVFGALEITRSLIGTDHTGTKAVGNRVGVSFSGYVDGHASISDNVISGNMEVGVDCRQCTLSRNVIGLDISGRVAIPNGVGAKLSGITHGSSASSNVISGNDSTGIEIICGLTSSGLKGNMIGTDISGRNPLGNGRHGVIVTHCDYDAGVIWEMPIGGPLPQDRNVIAYNAGDGIRLGGRRGFIDVQEVYITNNSIFKNGGLGIAVDHREKSIPKPPVIDSVVVAGTTIGAFVSSVGAPMQEQKFEFFANDSPDPSGYGEGQTPLQIVTARANHLGFASASASFSVEELPKGKWLTATSTSVRESFGFGFFRATSPFSNALQVLDPLLASIDIQPLEIDFGPVALGTPVEKSFAIQNIGSAVVSIELVPAPDFTGNGFMLGDEPRSFSLDPGTTRSVAVRLQPISLSQKASSVNILHSASNPTSPVAVAVRGSGVSAQPAVAVEPMSMDFGSVKVGDQKDLTLNVANTGQGNLTGEIAPGPDFVGNGFAFASGIGSYSLGPGETLEVIVRLRPGTVGSKAASVLISHNATGAVSPTTIPLSGQGVAANAQIQVEPSALDFGQVAVGATHVDTIVIRHVGGSDPLIGSVSDFGDLTQKGIFYASGGGLFRIGPGQSHVVRLAFAPTAENEVSAQVKVNHNATNAPRDILVEVLGSGVRAVARPLVNFSVGDTLIFGEVPLGSHQLKTVLVSNSGGADLLLSTEISAASSFSRAGSDSVLIPAGEAHALSIRFEPSSLGARSAELSIEHDAPNAPSPYRVTLTGTGISAGDLGRPDLFSPSNGSIGVPTPVRFHWNEVVGAASYVLQISASSDFLILAAQTATESTMVDSVALDGGKAYYWRVVALRNGTTATSNIWSFTTGQVNRAPIAVTDSVHTLPGQSVVIDVLGNDSDPDGHAFFLVGIVVPPSNGLAIANPMFVQYWPDPGFQGVDEFSYRITDSFGLSSTGTVFVSVGVVTSITGERLPSDTSLGPNYPNPCHSSTSLTVTVAKTTNVEVALFDILGHRLMTLHDGILPSGSHVYRLDVSHLPTGTYLCVMRSEGKRQVQPILVAR